VFELKRAERAARAFVAVAANIFRVVECREDGARRHWWSRGGGLIGEL
jgi:hypothetical protein